MSKQRGSFELVFNLIVLGVILVCALIWHVAGGWIQCNNYGSITERDTKFSVISGCFVKSETGRWIPKDEMTRTTIVDNK